MANLDFHRYRCFCVCCTEWVNNRLLLLFTASAGVTTRGGSKTGTKPDPLETNAAKKTRHVEIARSSEEMDPNYVPTAPAASARKSSKAGQNTAADPAPTQGSVSVQKPAIPRDSNNFRDAQNADQNNVAGPAPTEDTDPPQPEKKTAEPPGTKFAKKAALKPVPQPAHEAPTRKSLFGRKPRTLVAEPAPIHATDTVQNPFSRTKRTLFDKKPPPETAPHAPESAPESAPKPAPEPEPESTPVADDPWTLMELKKLRETFVTLPDAKTENLIYFDPESAKAETTIGGTIYDTFPGILTTDGGFGEGQVLKTEDKCTALNENGHIYRFGLTNNYRFLQLYEVCYNYTESIALYSYHKVNGNALAGNFSANFLCAAFSCEDRRVFIFSLLLFLAIQVPRLLTSGLTSSILARRRMLILQRFTRSQPKRSTSRNCWAWVNRTSTTKASSIGAI